MRNLVHNRMFMLLISGQGISILGSRIYNIALMWYIMERTGSALSLGMSVICMTLPSIVLMPWSGVLADKNVKKEVMFLADMANGLIMFVLMLLAATGSLSMLSINICLILSSAVSAFFSPSLQAAIPLVVEPDQLPKANATFQFIQQISNISGPAIGGILIALLSPPALFAINGVSFWIAALFSLFLTIPKFEQVNQKEKYMERFIEGIRYTLKIRKLLYLILVGGVVINFFLAPLNVFLVYISNRTTGIGASGLGWIDAAISVGALLGTLLILGGFGKNQIQLAVIGLLIEGLALAFAGLHISLFALIVWFGLLGFGVCLASIGIRTAFQLLIDKDKMGRVMSVVGMLASCTVPLGTYAGSLLIGRWPIATILVVFGVAVSLSGVSLLVPFWTDIRKGKAVATVSTECSRSG